MPDRVSVDRQEFQTFLAENKQLVERYQKLVDKMNALRALNKDLEEKLHLADEKLGSIENRLGKNVQEADETLRKARATMTQLIEEAERRLSQ
jgi:cell division septum initiation protein DivIVA